MVAEFVPVNLYPALHEVVWAVHDVSECALAAWYRPDGHALHVRSAVRVHAVIYSPSLHVPHVLQLVPLNTFES